VALGLSACQGDIGPDPEPEPAAHITIATGSAQIGSAGQALARAIVARVTDAEGRGVPGVSVTFAATGGSGSLAPTTTGTDELGEAHSVWTLGTRAGPMTAGAAAAGLAPATATATAHPGPPARLGFQAVPQAAVAGVIFDPPVAVAIQDEYGNRVPGASAQVSLTVDLGQLAGPSSAPAVDGLARFSALHIDDSGSDYVLTATAEGLPPAESGAFPVASGVAARLRLLAGDGQQADAGRTVAIAPTVVVRDAIGNRVAGVSVDFTVSRGRGTVVPRTVTTGADGTASVTSWTLGTDVGTDTLRASAVAIPGASVEFQAEVLPGPVDPSRSSMEATPAKVLAGENSVVRVAARDAFGNAVSGAEVVLSATGTANMIAQPPVTDEQGIASGSFRSSNPGARTISAVAGGVSLGETASVLVEALPEIVEVTVLPGQAMMLVGQSVALDGAVLDDRGDQVPGATVTWSSSDSDVAGVSVAGMVTAVSPGQVMVSATSGGITGTATVNVSLNGGTMANVTYCTMDGDAVKMDVYIPDASKPRPLPVAVHVHGGGWTGGAKSSGSRFAELMPLLLERGYLVASLDYRLAPAHKYPAQIQDVKCAIRHLRARAWRYGLDPARIGAWGGSAGGQLVSLLGTADGSVGLNDAGAFPGESSEVQAVVAISAITDFTHPNELNDDYSRAFRNWPDPASPEMIEASPVTHVSPGDAPFFLIAGEDDELVLPAQSERIHHMLLDAGVSSILLAVRHADHDLLATDAPTEPSAAVINSRMADFFDLHLR
jgi:acetyl esterase/lipase